MSIFVGNTFTRVEDVQSMYNQIKKYDVDDIISGEVVLNDDVICHDDFRNRIAEIETDVKNILTLIEKYDTSSAIDELKILLEKLY